MYGQNTKYHSNPYIQGTTVPCDIYRKFSPVARLGGLAPARPTRNAHAHVMPRAMGANNVRVHENNFSLGDIYMCDHSCAIVLRMGTPTCPHGSARMRGILSTTCVNQVTPGN